MQSAVMVCMRRRWTNTHSNKTQASQSLRDALCHKCFWRRAKSRRISHCCGLPSTTWQRHFYKARHRRIGRDAVARWAPALLDLGKQGLAAIIKARILWKSKTNEHVIYDVMQYSPCRCQST